MSTRQLSFRWIRFNLSLICLGFLMRSVVYAQYFNEQVLEKSFEKTDFFFHPSYLNPYGIGGFGDVAPVLLDEPLLNLQLNPAYIVADSFKTQFLYMDFRNSRDIVDDSYYPGWPCSSYLSSSYLPYPFYYTQIRKALEPVFSGAYLLRPFQKFRDWTVGVTYQIISQDEPYYNVPQDVYQSNIGYDYNGNATAERSDIPIVDRYQGNDEMHQEGHFFSLFTGVRMLPRIDVGLRLSRVLFDRNGTLGSENQWEDNWYYDYRSYRYDEMQRSQEYAHWDISGGLNYTIKKDAVLGITGGYLKGQVDQMFNHQHQYTYDYDQENKENNWSHYYQNGYTDQDWNHDGRTFYGSLNLSTRLTSENTLNLNYKMMHENVDIGLFSNILDTSFSNYNYGDSLWQYEGHYLSKLTDDRTGSGNQEGLRHYLTAAMKMQIQPRTALHFGFQYQHHDVKTKTVENVLAYRFTDNHWEDNYNIEQYSHLVDEKKALHWDLKINTYTFQIPVVISHRLSKTFELMFGVNRRFTGWEITDQTLALFDYRDKTVNGEREYRENFGERYTQPREKRSDVQTLVLGGLTVIPSPMFNLRLLMVPRWAKTYNGTKLQEFQWWIHFNLIQ